MRGMYFSPITAMVCCEVKISVLLYFLFPELACFPRLFKRLRAPRFQSCYLLRFGDCAMMNFFLTEIMDFVH
jgi:hypothetical protein